MAQQFVTITIQGLNTVQQGLHAANVAMGHVAPAALDMSGELGVQFAKTLSPVLTGFHRDTIGVKNKGGRQRSGFFLEYGSDSPYGRVLEYGDMYRAPQPHIIPSLSIAGQALAQSMSEAMTVAFGGRGSVGSGVGGGAIRNEFAPFRSFLYSTSKALGDVSVLGGREVFGPVRASMYNLAKLTGDIGAGQYLGQRVTNRLQGRAVGKLAGYGTRSLSHSQSYSGFVGGSAGHRIYSRAVGRAGNISFSGFGSLGDMF